MRTRAMAVLALLAIPTLLPPAARAVPPPAPTGDELRAMPADAWDAVKARHLLARAGFGGTPEEIERLRALGLDRAVDSLVDYRGLADVDLPCPIAPVTPVDPAALAKLTPEERLKANQQRQRDEQLGMNQVREWWIVRMIRSPRPLEEKLVLFWHGHFANEFKTVRNPRAMYDQNQLFRKHANGNFGALLHAVIHDPAMLRYLDNHRNTKNRPNENLAREVMELFAMGVDQGYTEADIKEGARALTGLTYDPKTWQFKYVAGAHDAGPKTIFGKTGNYNGDQFIDQILEQPSTARFIARKLFVYFAHDDPSDAVVDRLAALLRQSNYELAPVLKALFRSDEFYSTRSVGTQVKSPVQLVVGAARQLGRSDIEPAFVANVTRAMGQELFEPPNVKGWAGGRAWINTNTLFTRANLPVAMLGSPPGGPAGKGKGQGRAPALPKGTAGKSFDAVAYLQGKAADTPAAVVDEFVRVLFAVPVGSAERAEMVEFLGPLPPKSEWAGRKREVNTRLTAVLVLMMGLPEYQLT